MGDFSSLEPSCHVRKKTMRLVAGGGKKTTPSRAGSDWRDWARLPRNVLHDIMDRLTVVDDYVRVGAVCAPWRSIVIQERNSNHKERHCSQPFLLVSSPPSHKFPMALYSLSRGKIYEFDLQLADCPEYNAISRVSSLGWLITMETEDYKHYNSYLENPFLPCDRRIIQLPPLDNIIQQHPDDTRFGYEYYFRKAALSSDPLSSDEFVVVAIMNRCAGLAFFKSGNDEWTSIGEWRQRKRFLDVIFSQKTQQFYLLRDKGQVLAIDLVDLKKAGGGEPNFIQLMPPTYQTLELGSDAYLVENVSSGEEELFWACKCFSSPNFYFIVFKFDRINKSWSRIHSLDDKVMFLGLNNSVVRSSSDCPGCKPNCIYFTDNFFCGSTWGKRYGPPHDGIYSFVQNRILEHYSMQSDNVTARPIWIQPTLVYT